MIDFHCHLDLYPDPAAVVRECVRRGIYVLSVTTTPSAWEGTTALIPESGRIRVALGLHPELAKERRSELPLFENLIARTRYVGEIGLDGSTEVRGFWADQKYVFDHILALCQAAGGRIMTIHSRRAAREVLDSLEVRPGAGTPILHWFSGSSRELARAVGLGCWFSIGPAMLRSERGRALAGQMPRDRILTETDGPFAQIEGASVLPWEVKHATDIVAALWDTSPDEVDVQLNRNLRRLVSLSPATGSASGN
jgi:TatD DNase family protein